MPIRGFFIIVVDSWKRQLTAGRDSTRQYSFPINTQLVESYLQFYSGCRFRIVRHSEESTFPAGTTPQGFRNQHSPLTMFRTVEVLLLSLSIALQRQVFTYKIHNNTRVQMITSKYFSCLSATFEYTRDISETQSSHRMKSQSLEHSAPHVIYFSHTQSWQRLILIG